MEVQQRQQEPNLDPLNAAQSFGLFQRPLNFSHNGLTNLRSFVHDLSWTLVAYVDATMEFVHGLTKLSDTVV